MAKKENSKSVMIRVRCTPEEVKTYKEAAEKSGKTMSKYIRDILNGKEPIVIPGYGEQMKKLVNDITHIGWAEVKLDKDILNFFALVVKDMATHDQAVEALKKMRTKQKTQRQELLSKHSEVLKLLNQLNQELGEKAGMKK